ncbi:MAG: hypothetical protein Sapg2KO_14590 [Saprospiraceae bacterium]
MIVKVNRVTNEKEIKRLLSEGVDIIGVSLKLTENNSDFRALNIEEIQNIQREVSIPNLSLNLNINEYTKEDVLYVAQKLKPTSLNIFIEASSICDVEKINNQHLQTIKAINDTRLDVISFGNGFGYDGPSAIPDCLRIYENLKYEEVNIDTLGSNSQQRIRSRKEWAKLLNIQEVDQSRLGDTILESITESMKKRPFLVDDRNIEIVSVEQLNEIGATGVTMSISCKKEESNKFRIANHIASMKDFEKILEITKRIKKYGS